MNTMEMLTEVVWKDVHLGKDWGVSIWSEIHRYFFLRSKSIEKLFNDPFRVTFT